jgi:mycofactocin precursor
MPAPISDPPTPPTTGPEGSGAVVPSDLEAEILVEDVSIDGMCGVY